MAEVNETVVAGLTAYYEYVAAHLHKWVDPLSNEQFWRKPYPYGNSVGHLVLHVTGNLNYYIGARVAETGYVRDRDREFTDKQPPPKEEALRAFDRTIAMVVATIRKHKAEDWGKAYHAVQSGHRKGEKRTASGRTEATNEGQGCPLADAVRRRRDPVRNAAAWVAHLPGICHCGNWSVHRIHPLEPQVLSSFLLQ